MSTHRITHIAFWAGGVLLPEIGKRALEAVSANTPLEVDDRFALYRLASDLTMGRIDSDAFFQQILKLGNEVTIHTITTAAFTQGVNIPESLVALIKSMVGRYQLSLLSDYPAVWLESILPGTFLAEVFRKDKIWYTSDLAAGKDYDNLFAEVIRQGALFPDKSLLIDCNSRRTSAALRLGIDSSIYVDTRRLRRDLALWTLPPFD